MFRGGILALGLILLGSCSPYALPPASRFTLPNRISELGVYSDLRAGTVADGARPYRPSFALWSDGASKRRWIRLPAGATIDTADMNSWRFPVGTELWKEFSVDGKRIETRVLRKVNPSDDGWAAMTYAWNEAQDEAVAAPDGVENALGTKFDIPSARTCMACHGGRPERVLGFSAIQLAHEAKAPDEATLDRLVAEARLTKAPAGPIQVLGSPVEVAAIGYLHANCGHCHNSGRPADAKYFRPPRSIDFGLRIEDLASPQATAAYKTSKTTHLILPRMTHGTDFTRRMPPLATEQVDSEGVAVITAWLQGGR